jgi:hypothetical protein
MRFLLIFLITISPILATPKWVNSPVEFCPSSELCAVGEAAGAMIAEMSARDSLAKIFETRVSSDKEITTISSTTSDSDGPLDAIIDEEFKHKINELTDEVIQGAYIKERFESSDAHFALIALPKMKASKILEDKMRELDTLNDSLIKDGRRSSLNITLKNIKIRNKLHERYRVLRSTDFSSPISLSKVYDLKKKKRDLAVKVKLRVKEISKGKEIKKSIAQNLVENDFILSTQSPKFTVDVQLVSEKQYMKVEGFIKYKFILQASSKNLTGDKIGSLKYEIIQTGRSKKQAYENAVPGLKKFINDKFDELNID